MSPGTLVPFLKVLGLPGDTFDIDLNADVKTHPTIGPLFASFKVQLDVYWVPLRLYNSATHNNALGIGMKMSQIKLPTFDFLIRPKPDAADFDNVATNPSSLLAYLGFRGPGFCTDAEKDTMARKVNAVPLLAYWDIYKNYYSNKQEEVGYVIRKRTGGGWANPDEVNILQTRGDGVVESVAIPWIDDGGTFGNAMNGLLQIRDTTSTIRLSDIVLVFWDGTTATAEQIFGGVYDVQFISPLGKWQWQGKVNPQYLGKEPAYWRNPTVQDAIVVEPELYQFPLENIDKMRELILAKPPLQRFSLNDSGGLEPYDCNYTLWGPSATEQYLGAQWTQQGLGIKTYQSDLFNNWLSTDWITGTGGINDITKVDTSAGYFNIDALNLSKKVYDMLNRIAVTGGTFDDWMSAVYDHEGYGKPETPVYMGGLSKELVFQEVVSNSAEGGEPLGTLAGKGVMGSLPSKCGTYSLYAAIIVKKVDAKTRAKTSLNELLRED